MATVLADEVGRAVEWDEDWAIVCIEGDAYENCSRLARLLNSPNPALDVNQTIDDIKSGNPEY